MCWRKWQRVKEASANSNTKAEAHTTLKNQGNMAPHKQKGSSPAPKPKGTGYCDLTDRESKVALMKKLSNLQENSERQFNEIRKKLYSWRMKSTNAWKAQTYWEFFSRFVTIWKIFFSLAYLKIRVQYMYIWHKKYVLINYLSVRLLSIVGF